MNALDLNPPNFDAIYFDTNALLGAGWPDPSVVLHNVCTIAKTWEIQLFLPEPVIKEAEEHWLRMMKEQMSRVTSAIKDLQRVAIPAVCDARVEHTSIELLHRQYLDKRDAAIARYGLSASPFTKRSIDHVFRLATKYVMPFEHDKEGKGFQDAVILLSILEHLSAEPKLKGVFVTKDGSFRKCSYKDLVSGFEQNRLRIADFDAVRDELFRPYFDQTVLKPWEEERRNALTAAKALEPELRKFLTNNLTESMLRSASFASVVRLQSVDMVQVNSVDTPIPDMYQPPDRKVEFTIAVSVDCSAIVRKNSALWSLFTQNAPAQSDPSDEPEVEEKASWSGGIRALADVVNRQFRNIVPQSLVSDEELRNKSQKA